jgi:hypothetical protein
MATNARGAIVWVANGVLRALDSRGSRVLATETAQLGTVSNVRASAKRARWRQGAGEHQAPLG